ncbi:protein OS-9 isoform X3 [Struthio camelus]|uniref:protein OS-9 isoform X3 n=1 Tax=Struthio camelus TaxID=8801 RepID=UPI003603CE33
MAAATGRRMLRRSLDQSEPRDRLYPSPPIGSQLAPPAPWPFKSPARRHLGRAGPLPSDWLPPALTQPHPFTSGEELPSSHRGLSPGGVIAAARPMEDALGPDGRATGPTAARISGGRGGRGEAAGGSGGQRWEAGGKMAARRGPGPVPVLLLAVLTVLGPGRPLRGARAALNLQELSELKYGIEILAEPVLAGQRQAEDVVTVASKFKQRYECRLPPAAMRRQPDPEEEAQLYNGSGITELLRPMGAAPCLVKTKDWWTYEFCYGKHIQQYHVEESEIKGDVLFLGYYQSAFDWDDETAKASKQHRLKRYHSQSYVNGSQCDLTGRAREAEVRFLCEEGAGDYIARVDEPQSCSYVLTVHTTRICHHPFLRPPASATPQSILCQPALSPAQYVEYVRAQVSDTKRKVEEISEELKTLDTRLWSEKDPEASTQPPEGATAARSNAAPGDEADAAKDAAFWERVREVTSKASSQQDSAKEEEPAMKGADSRAADNRKKIHFKVIRNPGDLLQFIEELKENTKKAREKAVEEEAEKSPDPPVPEEPPATTADGERPEEEEDEEEEGDLLGGFEKELEAVLLPRDQMAQLKEEVKTEMEKEFDNIINEVEDELETEGLKGEFDRNQASKSLASTLNRLMDKLDGGRSSKAAEKEEEEGPRSKASPGPPAEQASDTGSDGRVRVQVSRIRPGTSQHREHRVREMGRDNPQLHHIESEVRELLAKEGLRAEGKIEIKIVTTGGPGDDDDTHWLSDEDTKNLKDIFFNILIQGTEEAQKERRRQQALEDNYRFVWGRRNEPQPPGDSEDSDF